MKEVVSFLKENSVQYAATIGADGKPKVRPFQFMTEDDGRLWFCTNSGKDVYKELMANPFIEFCASSPQFEWIRLSGKAVFSDNRRVKEKILEISPLVKSLYKTADNPIFEVFSLEGAAAVMADFSGKPPRNIL